MPLKWSAMHGTISTGAIDRVKAIAVDPQGNVVVAGTSESIRTLADWVVIKYDNDGAQVWERRFDGGKTVESLVAISMMRTVTSS